MHRAVGGLFDANGGLRSDTATTRQPLIDHAGGNTERTGQPGLGMQLTVLLEIHAPRVAIAIVSVNSYGAYRFM